MPRYKEVDYSQTILLPISYSEQILKGTFEYTLCYLIDSGSIDLSVFNSFYKNEQCGSKAYPPGVLLKLILYAYSRGILSSRRIEELSGTNIIAIALTGNIQPDHSTISSFINRMGFQIQSIFENIVSVCVEMKLIGGEIFAIDGCKLSSNASKEHSGKMNDFIRKRDRIKEVIKTMIEQHKKQDKQEGFEFESEENFRNRILRKKRLLEKYNTFIDTGKIKLGKRTDEIQSNITDFESCKMKTSHGVIQGYNGMGISDKKHQVIVYAEAFGSGQEHDLFIPCFEGMQKLLNKVTGLTAVLKGKKVLADTGNYSDKNIKYIYEKEIDGYIPDPNFRKRDIRFRDRRLKMKKDNFIKKEEFNYDNESDHYICPAGKKLERKPDIVWKRRMKNVRVKKYYISNTICKECKLRPRCIKKKGTQGKIILITESDEKINYSELMRNKIDTIEGRKNYSMRMSIIEPVFGNIRTNKGMNRFLFRGKSKVNIQWTLFSLVHNIGKIQKFGNL
ncbi:MAG: IS1182 family transposase [Leptospiraceae bacterium]|nr:IS1182 family transposase [Leptospiraceae bacterium]